jgi:hypothetical protein
VQGLSEESAGHGVGLEGEEREGQMFCRLCAQCCQGNAGQQMSGDSAAQEGSSTVRVFDRPSVASGQEKAGSGLGMPKVD